LDLPRMWPIQIPDYAVDEAIPEQAESLHGVGCGFTQTS
jgi:hypothetical protein